MSQTLLIEDDSDKRNVISVNLNVFTGTDVVVKGGHQEALALLRVHPSINLIVCENSIGNEATAFEIYRYLERENRRIPMIVLGEGERPLQTATILDQGSPVDSVVLHAAKALRVSPKVLADLVVPELFPIPIVCFSQLNPLPCDVYLRIRRSERGDHYMKRFKSGEEGSEGAVERYIEYGETHLFVPAQDRFHFVQTFTAGMVEKLKNANLPLAERDKVAEGAQKVLAVNLETMEWSEDLVNLTNASIESVRKSVDSFTSLKALLDHLLANHTGFLYLHCQLIIFAGNHILRHIGWGSEEQMQKLGMVAFFHDLLLFEDEQARVRSEEELGKSGLSEKERRAVTKHAQWISEIIKKFPHAPMDIDVIIKQHHGVHNGIGFVDQFHPNISPLAMVFIVAEEFAHQLIASDGKNFEKNRAIKGLEERFPSMSYRKITDTLKSLSWP